MPRSTNTRAGAGDNAVAADLERAMLAQANPADAAVLQYFFKTGKGQYAEGDKFLGVRNPSTRRTAKAFANLPVEEAAKTARSQWHELRLCSLLIMANKYQHKITPEHAREDIFRIYTRLAQEGFVNNWDLVDLKVIDDDPQVDYSYRFEIWERK